MPPVPPPQVMPQQQQLVICNGDAPQVLPLVDASRADEASPQVAREDTRKGARRHPPVNTLLYVVLHGIVLLIFLL